MDELTDKVVFNKNQETAIEWRKQPLLVTGSTATGKTSVLAERIVRIIEGSKGEHFRILALSVSHKSILELEQKVSQQISLKSDRLNITTYQSFAAGLLQLHGLHIHLSTDVKLLENESDRLAILEDSILKTREITVSDFPLHLNAKSVLPIISLLLDSLVPPDGAEPILKQVGVRHKGIISDIYNFYWNWSIERNTFDSQTILVKAIELFKKIPFLPKHVRTAYRHLLVDDFQHTSLLQYTFLRYISEPDASNLFVVGDDCDRLKWQYPLHNRFEKITKYFNMCQIRLPQNYRCPDKLIEMSNTFISNNSKKYIGDKLEDSIYKSNKLSSLKIHRFNELDEELSFIVKEISKKPKNQRCECAVICGINRLLNLINDKLNDNKITTHLSRQKFNFSSAPFRMLCAIINLTTSKDDMDACFNLSNAFFEIEGIELDLYSLMARAFANGTGLLANWIDAMSNHPGIAKDTATFFKMGFDPLLIDLNYPDFADNLFAWYQIRMDAAKPSDKHPDSDYGLFLEDQKEWKDMESVILAMNQGIKLALHLFLEQISLLKKIPPKDPLAVTCATMRDALGLKCKYVYLIGMTSDQVPSYSASQQGRLSKLMEKEREACFDVITGTSEILTITFSEFSSGSQLWESSFLSDMRIFFY
jgi:DNA helicase-2/ATP-dependent DNA helicase PcrA